MIQRFAYALTGTQVLAALWFLYMAYVWAGAEAVPLAFLLAAALYGLAKMRKRVCLLLSQGAHPDNHARGAIQSLLGLGAIAGTGSLVLAVYAGPHGASAALFGLLLEALALYAAKRRSTI